MLSFCAASAFNVSCGKGADDDGGATALSSFREFVASTFTEVRQKPFSWMRDTTCKFRTDVRSTRAVAEPFEGLLHVDVTWIHDDADDFRPSPVSSSDLVFDRVGNSWVCSETKSTLATSWSKQITTDGACSAVARTCQKAPNVTPAEKPRQAVSLYPAGWDDLPPYGETLFEQAIRGWQCSFVSEEVKGVRWKSCELCRDKVQFRCASLSFAVATKTGTRVDRIDNAPTTSLTFVPANETSYNDAVSTLKKTWRSPPDATRKSNEEGGEHHSACWRTSTSITTIEGGFPIAKGSIVTVTARETDPCAARRD